MPVELSMPMAVACAVLMIAGSLFAVLAALGVLRLPDVYTRMHAASKAGAVGSGLLLLAAGLYLAETPVLIRAVAGGAFLLLTAPVSAHLIARAAHLAGYPLASVTVMDELPVLSNSDVAADQSISKKNQVYDKPKGKKRRNARRR